MNRPRTRPFRSFVKRRVEHEENYFQVDWSRGTRANVEEVLYRIVTEADSPKAKKLAYLNCFTKICSKLTGDSDAKGLGFLPEEIFCCLRVALLDEAYDVRAAGLRAMRHLIINADMGRAFIDSNQEHLLVRSLDINLDNKVERLQALRLIRHLIAIAPGQFPVSAARALVAIARDGMQEQDNLTRPCCAAIAELCLRNVPVAASAGCFSALLDGILHNNVPQAICESLIGTILFTLNDPSSREHLCQDQGLQFFVAPFTDCYNNSTNFGVEQNVETNEQRQMRLTTAKRALLTILRSWPGLIYFCRYSGDASQGSNAIQSLVQTLQMPYEDTRRNILDLLFELLDVPMPSHLSDSEQFSFDVLSSYHVWAARDSWQIYDGFVAAEGKHLLPHISRCRINLFDNYLSIILYVLVSYGIVESLVQVIITSKTTMFSNSIRATILLAEILHHSSRLLPHEVYRKCHALPDLVNAATCSSHSMEVRGIASTAIAALHRMHLMRRTSVMPFSLYLNQVIKFANMSSPPHLSDMKSRLQLKSSIAHEAEDMTGSHVRDSNVLTHDFKSFNWNLISSVLTWPTDEFKRLEDPSYRTFVRKLLDFFKPSSRGFSQIGVNDDRGREMAIACCHFIDFLLEIDDVRSAEFLGEFLRDLGDLLSQTTSANPQSFQNTILSSTKLMTTLSHYYFLVIGRMTSSNKGSKMLENLGFYQHLSSLVSLAGNDIYCKLIISSLDYTREGFSRKILIKGLTCGSDSSRLYATNFLLVLLRCQVPDFHKWALPLLVQQLYDESESISLAAAAILLESCDLKPNLEALISLKPSLMHLKHIGLMLQIRFVSLPIGVKFLTESKMLDSLLLEWRKSYNLKYVHIVEDAINESLTSHVRTQGGTYGSRRSDQKSIDRNTFLPPHLHGQLAATEIGMKLLTSDDCLTSLLSVIRGQDFDCDRKMLDMKASLWSIGHVMSTPLGLAYITETDPGIIPAIAKMATECSVLSLRGTCFYILSMIAMTERGVHHLDHMGWQGLTHCRGEVWPLEDLAQDHHNVFQCFRQRKYHTNSDSSSTRKLSDPKQEVRDPNGGKELDNNSLYSPNQEDEVRSRTSSLDPNLTVRSLPSQQLNTRRDKAEVCRKTANFLTETCCPFDVKDVAYEVKSRSSSYNNDTSIISSGISLTSNGCSSAGKSFPKLSPIASISSPNHLSASQSCYATYHPLMPILSSSSIDGFVACTTDRDGDHAHSHHQPFETQPSSADAHGYATLRAINRRRVHSMGIQASADLPSAVLSDPASPPASPCSSAHSFDAYDANDLFSNDSSLYASLTLPAGFMSESLSASPTVTNSNDTFSKEEGKVFIGIVIPVSLSLLFEPPPAHGHHDDILSKQKPPASDDAVLPERGGDDGDDVTEALELHANHNCLLCYRVIVDKNDELDGHPHEITHHTESVAEGAVATPATLFPPKNLLQPQTLKHIVSASSIASGGSTGEAEAIVPDSTDGQLLIRKEALRFVTNLSGSVAAKAAEQGMLNLKQRFPRAFQEDICLYSEICLQLATYNFRLSARKFLQEIFQDINYEQLRTYAKEIIGKRANSSFREQDDESSEEKSTSMQ